MSEGRTLLYQGLYSFLQAVAALLVALVLVFLFVGRLTVVDGVSMEPTLRDGDVMVVRSLGYMPEPGDVVVLHKPSEVAEGPIVKRVIATGGQTVEVDYAAGVVRVDGQVLLEPYRSGPGTPIAPSRPSRCPRGASSCWGITGTSRVTAGTGGWAR